MAAKVSVGFGKLSDTGLDNFVQGVNAALTAVAGGFSLARARLGSRFGFCVLKIREVIDAV